MLGLAGMIVPARASMSFYNGTSTNSQFNSDALGAAISLNALEFFSAAGFTGSPMVFTDSNGIEFLGFSLSGSGASATNGAQNDVTSSGTALQQTSAGGMVEITNLPANTFAFGFNIVAPVGSILGFCMGVNHASFNASGFCDDTFGLTSNSDVEFIGVISTVPVTSLWIGPGAGNFFDSEKFNLNSFQFGTEGAAAPEPGPLALLGGGLVAIGLLKRGLPKQVAGSFARYLRAALRHE